jgi:hypothetical protein
MISLRFCACVLLLAFASTSVAADAPTVVYGLRFQSVLLFFVIRFQCVFVCVNVNAVYLCVCFFFTPFPQLNVCMYRRLQAFIGRPSTRYRHSLGLVLSGNSVWHHPNALRGCPADPIAD